MGPAVCARAALFHKHGNLGHLHLAPHSGKAEGAYNADDPLYPAGRGEGETISLFYR